ncbi:MAG: cytochrome c biogenesis heme-transporting ATPase CcmA [Betaproteobacteria bacterium]
MLLARDLRLERGSRAIINGLSFTVESGQTLVLRGSNGSGKTSLLRILAGLSLPDKGAVAWRGETLKALSATWRNAVLYLGHTNALKEDFTAQENLRDALLIDGMTITPAVQMSALEKVGLLDRRNVLARRLSQGQKRRVGLARLALALAHHPYKPLWLLDEPTNALDEKGVSLFTGLISEHLNRGGIACIATHLILNLAAPVTELNLDDMAELAK